jgi:hypothetical protein
VGDIDVLLSRRDAEALFATLGLAHQGATPHPLFRSALLARWLDPPLPVEFMADFDVFADDRWQPVNLTTRIPIPLNGLTGYVPSRAELLALLRRFNRAKDAPRIAALAAISAAWAPRPGSHP